MRARILNQPGRPADIFQGEDKTLTVWLSDDLTTATEIEFTVDAATKISKTLSAGDITGVTASQMTVQIDAADTTNLKAGAYKHQARATIAGKLSNIRFTPNKISIKDSVFVDDYPVNDYS